MTRATWMPVFHSNRSIQSDCLVKQGPPCRFRVIPCELLMSVIVAVDQQGQVIRISRNNSAVDL